MIVFSHRCDLETIPTSEKSKLRLCVGSPLSVRVRCSLLGALSYSGRKDESGKSVKQENSLRRRKMGK